MSASNAHRQIGIVLAICHGISLSTRQVPANDALATAGLCTGDVQLGLACLVTSHRATCTGLVLLSLSVPGHSTLLLQDWLFPTVIFVFRKCLRKLPLYYTNPDIVSIKNSGNTWNIPLFTWFNPLFIFKMESCNKVMTPWPGQAKFSMARRSLYSITVPSSSQLTVTMEVRTRSLSIWSNIWALWTATSCGFNYMGRMAQLRYVNDLSL